MPTFALQQDAPNKRLIARRSCFSALPRVIATSTSYRTQHLAGAGISMRPFARSQRRFRHHCEVNVPGLHLRFPIENICEAVRFMAISLPSVSRPNRGDVNARNPFFAPVFDSPNSCPVSTPPSGLFRKPLGSKRSTGSKPGSSSCQTSDGLLLPAARSYDWPRISA